MYIQVLKHLYEGHKFMHACVKLSQNELFFGFISLNPITPGFSFTSW